MLPNQLAARLLLVVTLLAAPVAIAQQNFDAVVSGVDNFGSCMILPLNQPVVQWFNPARTDMDDDVRMIASGDGRRVFALLSGTPSQIVELRSDGTRLPFFTAPMDFGFSYWIAVARDGRVFLSTGGVTPRLARISAAGTLEATYPFPAANIAVGADGCTINYFTAVGGIRRFNGCTGAALPDFATPAGSLDAIAVLPSGEVLVASGTTVSLFDASGALVRVVADLDNLGLADRAVTAIAEKNGVVFIAAVDPCDSSLSALLRVGMSDGSEISRTSLAMTFANAIVIGTAALSIPTAGEVALLLLAFVLAAGGALVLDLR